MPELPVAMTRRQRRLSRRTSRQSVDANRSSCVSANGCTCWTDLVPRLRGTSAARLIGGSSAQRSSGRVYRRHLPQDFATCICRSCGHLPGAAPTVAALLLDATMAGRSAGASQEAAHQTLHVVAPVVHRRSAGLDVDLGDRRKTPGVFITSMVPVERRSRGDESMFTRSVTGGLSARDPAEVICPLGNETARDRAGVVKVDGHELLGIDLLDLGRCTHALSLESQFRTAAILGSTPAGFATPACRSPVLRTLGVDS